MDASEEHTNWNISPEMEEEVYRFLQGDMTESERTEFKDNRLSNPEIQEYTNLMRSVLDASERYQVKNYVKGLQQEMFAESNSSTYLLENSEELKKQSSIQELLNNFFKQFRDQINNLGASFLSPQYAPRLAFTLGLFIIGIPLIYFLIFNNSSSTEGQQNTSTLVDTISKQPDELPLSKEPNQELAKNPDSALNETHSAPSSPNLAENKPDRTDNAITDTIEQLISPENLLAFQNIAKDLESIESEGLKVVSRNWVSSFDGNAMGGNHEPTDQQGSNSQEENLKKSIEEFEREIAGQLTKYRYAREPKEEDLIVIDRSIDSLLNLTPDASARSLLLQKKGIIQYYLKKYSDAKANFEQAAQFGLSEDNQTTSYFYLSLIAIQLNDQELFNKTYPYITNESVWSRVIPSQK